MALSKKVTAARKPSKASGKSSGKPSGKTVLPAALAKRPLSGSALVVVGGSAGGLDSLKAMVGALPATFPAPILAVLHLDPHEPSHAAELLQRFTQLSVIPARHGARLRQGTLYLAPPDRHLEVKKGVIVLSRSPRINFSRPSVDRLLGSAAEAYGKAAIAVIVSGAGSDGQEGIERIKSAGGVCVAEDAKSAAQRGMPDAAAATGCLDAVLPATQLGEFLVRALRQNGSQVPASAWKAAAAILKSRGGVDFDGYRNETLLRQMQGRMTATRSKSAAQYVALLRTDEAELHKLRSALLIKVSSFNRDPEYWEVLQKKVLTPLLRNVSGREVRMWSAGCANGEEPYSLAVLSLASSKRRPLAIKVFGTDLDEAALTKARAGHYTTEQMENLSKANVRKYFQTERAGYRVGAQVRRHVIFGRHDLLRDPPLTGMDLVVCRNVLIYLKPRERQEMLNRLTYALRPGGILFLGKAEGARIPGFGFERIVRGAPIFRRSTATRAPLPTTVPAGRPRSNAKPSGPASEPILFATDDSLRVTLWNHGAERFFGLTSAHAVGNSLRSLIPGAPAEPLETSLRAAAAGRKRTKLPRLSVTRQGGRHLVDLECVPVEGGGLMFMGSAQARVASTKATLDPDLLKASSPDGGADSSEWASLNEELQSTAEAQQSLNEELQSRNEELETLNEELQSLNDEVQVQGEEARHSTLFLRALLDSGPDALIGCDPRGRVTFWGKPAIQQFGVSEEQALGKDLLHLVPQLDTKAVRDLLGQGKVTGHLSPRSAKAKGGLSVLVVPAMDNDKRYGTLLRVLHKPASKSP